MKRPPKRLRRAAGKTGRTFRTYTIIQINCDCASGTIASSTRKWLFGPRCPTCHRVLGFMSWRIVGKVRAEGDLSAVQRFFEAQKYAAAPALECHHDDTGAD